jgi:hypothetical protein
VQRLLFKLFKLVIVFSRLNIRLIQFARAVCVSLLYPLFPLFQLHVIIFVTMCKFSEHIEDANPPCFRFQCKKNLIFRPELAKLAFDPQLQITWENSSLQKMKCTLATPDAHAWYLYFMHSCTYTCTHPPCALRRGRV